PLLIVLHLSSLSFSHTTSTTGTYTLSLHDALPICMVQIIVPDCVHSTPAAFQGSHQVRILRVILGDDEGRAPLRRFANPPPDRRSEEHTSELQSHLNLVCRLLLEKKKKNKITTNTS